jgi:hypothetical protein
LWIPIWMRPEAEEPNSLQTARCFCIGTPKSERDVGYGACCTKHLRWIVYGFAIFIRSIRKISKSDG